MVLFVLSAVFLVLQLCREAIILIISPKLRRCCLNLSHSITLFLDLLEIELHLVNSCLCNWIYCIKMLQQSGLNAIQPEKACGFTHRALPVLSLSKSLTYKIQGSSCSPGVSWVCKKYLALGTVRGHQLQVFKWNWTGLNCTSAVSQWMLSFGGKRHSGLRNLFSGLQQKTPVCMWINLFLRILGRQETAPRKGPGKGNLKV